MLVQQQHVHLEYELIKWIALVALAGAILLFATKSASEEIQIANDQKPAVVFASYGVKTGPTLNAPPNLNFANPFEVWQLLKLHHDGNHEKAATGWERILLKPEAETWKSVALGSTYLRMGELDAAVTTLKQAETDDPGNALVHYFLGVVRLAQSRHALDWPDAIQSDRFVWVSKPAAEQPPSDLTPNSRSMYRYVSRQHFEQAVELADTVLWNQPLTQWKGFGSSIDPESSLVPTVKDLLVALDAKDFRSKSQLALARFGLDRGNLAQAERYLDEASTELNVAEEFEKLAAKYESENRPADALRVHLKSLKGNKRIGRILNRAIDNLREGF